MALFHRLFVIVIIRGNTGDDVTYARTIANHIWSGRRIKFSSDKILDIHKHFIETVAPKSTRHILIIIVEVGSIELLMMKELVIASYVIRVAFKTKII